MTRPLNPGRKKHRFNQAWMHEHVTDHWVHEAKAKGYVSAVPHYNTVYKYLKNPALTAILRALIVESSRPLRSIECDFAPDSSGFATSRFVRWFASNLEED